MGCCCLNIRPVLPVRMLRKTLLFAPIVAAAAGLPVAASKSDLFRSKNGPASGFDAASAAWPSAPSASVPTSGYSSLPSTAPTLIRPNAGIPAATAASATADSSRSGLTPMPLESVFRLDVDPNWVSRNWSRVSTTLADPQMPGMRVPLVTGYGVDDLSGSLSLYFDGARQVQRMQFHGYTGDPRKIAQFVQARYQMRPYAGMGQSLYISQWNGVPTSVLQIGFAPATIANHHPYRKYEVRLELNRPAAYYKLSPEFQAIVDFERTRTRM